ncbi:hypothetical protein H4R35_003933, partial [Dimargaris xerosporica]
MATQDPNLKRKPSSSRSLYRQVDGGGSGGNEPMPGKGHNTLLADPESFIPHRSPPAPPGPAALSKSVSMTNVRHGHAPPNHHPSHNYHASSAGPSGSGNTSYHPNPSMGHRAPPPAPRKGYGHGPNPTPTSAPSSSHQASGPPLHRAVTSPEDLSGPRYTTQPGGGGGDPAKPLNEAYHGTLEPIAATDSPNGKRGKGVFGNLMNSFSELLSGEKKAEISSPYNPVHITHVGFNSETGEFT